MATIQKKEEDVNVQVPLIANGKAVDWVVCGQKKEEHDGDLKPAAVDLKPAAARALMHMSGGTSVPLLLAFMEDGQRRARGSSKHQESQYSQKSSKKRRGRPLKAKQPRKPRLQAGPTRIKKSNDWFSTAQGREKWNQAVFQLGSNTTTAASLRTLVDKWLSYTNAPLDADFMEAAKRALEHHHDNPGACVHLLNSLVKYANGDDVSGQAIHRKLLLDCSFLDMITKFMARNTENSVVTTQCGLLAISTVLQNYPEAGGSTEFSAASVVPVIDAIGIFQNDENTVTMACDALVNLLCFDPACCAKEVLKLDRLQVLLKILTTEEMSLVARSSIVSVLTECSNAVEGADDLRTAIMNNHCELLGVLTAVIVGLNTAETDNQAHQSERLLCFEHGFHFFYNAAQINVCRRHIRTRCLPALIKVVKDQSNLAAVQEDFLGLFWHLLESGSLDVLRELRKYEVDMRKILLHALTAHKETPRLIEFALDLVAIYSAEIAPKEAGKDDVFSLTLDIIEAYTEKLVVDTDDQVQESLCYAMKALDCLAARDQANLKILRFSRHRVPDAVVSAMTAVAANSDLQEHGCNLLVKLIPNPPYLCMATAVWTDAEMMKHLINLTNSKVDPIKEGAKSVLKALWEADMMKHLTNGVVSEDQKKSVLRLLVEHDREAILSRANQEELQVLAELGMLTDVGIKEEDEDN